LDISSWEKIKNSITFELDEGGFFCLAKIFEENSSESEKTKTNCF